MDVKKELEKIGCIYKGHFVGTSDMHLSGYFNIDPVMPHSTLLNEFTKLMVEPFKDKEIQAVVTPATGAIPFTHIGALRLKDLTGREVLGVWADKIKVNGQKEFIFERNGFIEAVKGKRILILEDMINMMFSVNRVIKLVRKSGGEIIGVGSVAGNSWVTAKAMRVPEYNRLCLIKYDAWKQEECQLCKKGVPIVTDIGHGKEFEIAHPDYPGGYLTLAEQQNSQ